MQVLEILWTPIASFLGLSAPIDRPHKLVLFMYFRIIDLVTHMYKKMNVSHHFLNNFLSVFEKNPDFHVSSLFMKFSIFCGPLYMNKSNWWIWLFYEWTRVLCIRRLTRHVWLALEVRNYCINSGLDFLTAFYIEVFEKQILQFIYAHQL